MDKVLYLDVDGVLNDMAAHDDAAEDPNFQYDRPNVAIVFSHLLVGRYIGRVNQICIDGDVGVILCSELRRYVPLEALLRKSGFVGPILGMTSVVPPTRLPGTNERNAFSDEIERDIEKNGYKKFVVLTSVDTLLSEELEERAVRCEDGIEPEDVGRVVQLFAE